MKLHKEIESSRVPASSLDECLGELLWEAQCYHTQACMERKGLTASPLDVAYAAQTKATEKGKIRCYSCKEYGHIANQCKWKVYNYCKKLGLIILELSLRPANRNNGAYHATTKRSAVHLALS